MPRSCSKRAAALGRSRAEAYEPGRTRAKLTRAPDARAATTERAICLAMHERYGGCPARRAKCCQPAGSTVVHASYGRGMADSPPVLVVAPYVPLTGPTVVGTWQLV